MNNMTIVETLAAAAVLMAERVCAQADCEGDESLEEWLDDIKNLLLPLGEDGRNICLRLCDLFEYEDLTTYRAVAQINRSVGAVLGGQLVEYRGLGAEEGGHFPGAEGMDAEPLRRILSVWEKYSEGTAAAKPQQELGEENEPKESKGLTPKDYQMALDSQTACNLSGLIHSWSKVFPRIWEDVRAHGEGTLSANGHPICRLLLEQAYYLGTSGSAREKRSYSDASKICQQRAREKS